MSVTSFGKATIPLQLGDFPIGTNLIEGGSSLSTEVTALVKEVYVHVHYAGTNPPADKETLANAFEDALVQAINASETDGFGPLAPIINDLASVGFEVQFGADAGNGEIVELMFDFGGFYPVI